MGITDNETNLIVIRHCYLAKLT